MATALFSAGASMTFATHMRIRGEMPLIELQVLCSASGFYSFQNFTITNLPECEAREDI